VARVCALLPRPLVWTNTDLFILFGAGVPQVQLVGDVAADRISFAVEQCDAVRARSVEPIVRLAKHLGHEELHSRYRGKGELISVTGTDRTSGHRASGRIEHAVQVGTVMH